MDQIDQFKLHEMLALVQSSTPNGGSLAELAERLLTLRDSLSFESADWFHSLTQQIATLDSASTFEPSDASEAQQLDDAIKSATLELQHLIGKKLI